MPNWFIIFKLLQKEEELSVTQIADRIKIAHTSVISLTNKMIKADYLISTPCHIDTRRRYLTLSPKAKEKLPLFEQIWEAGELAVMQALEGTRVMEAMAKIEERFSERGFKDRTMTVLDAN